MTRKAKKQKIAAIKATRARRRKGTAAKAVKATRVKAKAKPKKPAKSLSRMIDALSPASYAYRSGKAAHDAADRRRTVYDWSTTPYSADGALLPEKRAIDARARAAKRNHWAARSAVDAYRRQVVGMGITARSAARDPSTNALLTAWNRLVDRKWDQWANSPQDCDIEGRKTFYECQGLTIEEFATVGESLTVINTLDGFKLQLLESEQLADDAPIRAENSENEIRGGVEINQHGRPVAYWLYPAAHPLDGGREKPVRIVASRVIHFFRQERPRQTRGITRFLSVLRDMHHLQAYEDFQMIRARLEACIGAAIRRNSNQLGQPFQGLHGPLGETGEDVHGNNELNFEPGMIWDLGTDGELQMVDSKAPGVFYDSFVNHKIKNISAGLGLDSSTVSRDYGGANFSSQREGHLERDREFDPLQKLLISLWCDPIRRAWLNWMITAGHLPDPPVFNFFDPLYHDSHFALTDWQPQPKEWIDPSNQAAATKMALEQRLTSPQRECNRLGVSLSDIIEDFREAQTMADAAGVTLPFAAESPKASPEEPRPEYRREPDTEVPEPEPVI